jgi:hypothetical protein
MSVVKHGIVVPTPQVDQLLYYQHMRNRHNLLLLLGIRN